MRTNIRKQTAIIAAGAAITVTFFAVLYVPMTRRLSSLRQEQRQHGMEAMQVSANALHKPALSDQLRAVQVRVGDFSARIPSSRQLGEFMQSVATIMNELGLRNQFLQPGQPLKSRPVHCIPVDIRCEGSFEQVFRFMKALEDIDRKMRFASVELSTDRNFSGLVSLHTRVYIYYKDDSGAEI
ncbi:MAG TPA: type 4a pilus biogenesis protein PilO [Sedimentisphaerales bacterium]|nr:type 4a pilus biogenesis protein PilO [Sedimentisphaerales bacterium]